MRTVILDPRSSGLDELLERRRRSGLDRLDEVWEGVLHMVPAQSGEHADVAQQLAELLGPLARLRLRALITLLFDHRSTRGRGDLEAARTPRPQP